MNRFWNGRSRNGLPWPRPLGTVNRSMKAMMRSERLPDAADEPVEFAWRGRRTRGEARPRCRGESEFACIADHVARRLVRGADERVLNGVAVGGLNHQSAGQVAALGEHL